MQTVLAALTQPTVVATLLSMAPHSLVCCRILINPLMMATMSPHPGVTMALHATKSMCVRQVGINDILFVCMKSKVGKIKSCTITFFHRASHL